MAFSLAAGLYTYDYSRNHSNYRRECTCIFPFWNYEAATHCCKSVSSKLPLTLFGWIILALLATVWEDKAPGSFHRPLFCHPAAYWISSRSWERGFSCRLLILSCSNHIYKKVTWDRVAAHVPSFWKDPQLLTVAANLCFLSSSKERQRTAAGSGIHALGFSAISQCGCKTAKFIQHAWTAFVDILPALRMHSEKAGCVLLCLPSVPRARERAVRLQGSGAARWCRKAWASFPPSISKRMTMSNSSIS